MNEFIKIRLEFIILFFCSLVYLATLVTFSLRKTKPYYVKAYMAFISICLYWSIGEVLVILFYHINRYAMEIIIACKYIGSIFLGPSWFIFSLFYVKSSFVKKGMGIKKTIYIILPMLPTAIMSYTTNYHHLFSRLINGLVYYSWGFWLHIFIVCCYYISGIILIIQNDFKRAGRVKKRNILIITGPVISLILTVLYYMFQLHLKLSNMDIVPSALLINLIFFVVASLKYRFLNILPIALPKVIQDISEGILIVDYEGNVALCNKSLADILRPLGSIIPSMAASEISTYMLIDGKYDNEGKSVVEAIQKGGPHPLKGEMELNNKQFQINYQPLFEDKELIGWIISFIDIGEHKALLNELSDKNRSLTEAYDKLLEHAKIVEELARAKERNRIAMEIHDSQGHCLSLVIALLEVARLTLPTDTKTCETKIDTAYEIAKKGLIELRSTVTNFVSIKASGKNSLVDKIDSLIDGFKAAGIECDITIHGSVPESLSEETSNTVYSICREALTNALKHGKASLVNVILRFNEKSIDLFIFDNGKGCDLINKGNGLKGMENRVLNLEGSISFGSGGEKGFSIHAEIPIN
ncbi:MAG TPA: histidine kinase N-terminal 7TM domain-containing protein [Clostridia bacterium]